MGVVSAQCIDLAIQYAICNMQYYLYYICSVAKIGFLTPADDIKVCVIVTNSVFNQFFLLQRTGLVRIMFQQIKQEK